MRRPYDTQYWRKTIRPTVLARDKGECQLRISEKCQGAATQVHHLVDWQDGGPPYALDNLAAVCQPCNLTARIRRQSEAVRRERTPTPMSSPSRIW